MCGVLGAAIKGFGGQHHEFIRGLFTQSMIRGKHATGVSYVKNGVVNTIREPVPAVDFIKDKNIADWCNEDGNLYMIGHARYSTSDLRFNQPIATPELAIAHNGVISQEPASTWDSTYGLKCATENDSELVLRALEKNLHPLTKFPEASMAVVTIDKYKRLTAFRNHQRPLYYTYGADGFTFASTADILKRAGAKFSCKMPMFEAFGIYNFKQESLILPHQFDIKDLQ